ncbi:MAG: hypothetical protein ACRC14_17925 [Paracoccaceae bacterium]
MRHWADLGRFHWLVLVLVMGLASVSIAWNSYGLIMLSMANVAFLESYGVAAIREGGLLQLALIGAKGLVALISYLLFKGIEVELMQRWRRLARRD